MDAQPDLPSPKQPSDALAAVVALRALADNLERKATIEALEQGWSWADIAEALGISRQAAHKRLAPVCARRARKK
jgi:DNA-directed RNA polymerase specialized sigma24 family protein